ncbi:Protein CBG08461 [Caenorhabditis briggsae]|uniref:Protein CBG08461 n=1 Tax=Caenorhabditis briggsae TaxID=6238 RepID=A8X6L8_CAEBR|nr:Protein CBG08461 [Caenorhabditis briggsae]CAP28279.1 Protein CBG08461 [Caenorhabditis briggsae]
MDEKAKRFVSKSRRNKPKHGSKGKVTSKLRSRCRKGGQKKSSTASKSNSAISPGLSNERNLEKNLEKNHPLEKREIEKKESEKESDKKKEEEKKKIEKRREREFKEDKEPDTDSDHDADLSLKKSHVAVPTRKGKPQKVAIKHNDVDEKETERLLKKLNDIKTEPARPQVTLDEKSKILMDRVEKKPYPAKYAKRNKWALLVEEDGEFFKPTPFTKAGSSTIVPVEDTYDYVPKLADVQKMEGENVFQTTMGEVPYWGVYLDPEEHDLDGIEPPISVGSEHVMAYHKKELPLKTPKCSRRSRPILSAREEKDRLLTSKKLDAKSPTPSKISKIEEEQKQQNIKIP